MNFIRKLLKIEPVKIDSDMQSRVVETELKTQAAQSELNQSLQRIDSQVRVFQTGAGALRIVRNARDEDRR